MKRANQRGSAMLIVFVFAAIVAIGLFTEMPVIIFEAQRNKEQLLVDRGNEYIQAVKLYRRKTGQFPPNLDALENTNRTRFLRKKFKDPFTDKADWRLLHAGPNGMLTDSKLKLAQNVTGAGNSALGTFNNNGTNQASSFGGSTPGNTGFGSGFNNSGFGNSGNSTNNNTNSNVSNSGFGAASQSSPQIPGQTSGGENANFQNGIGNPNGADPTLNPNQSNQQAGPGGFVQSLPNPDGTMPVIPRNANSARLAVPTGTNGSATGIVDPTQSLAGYASSSSGLPNAYQNTTTPFNPNAAVGGLVSNPNPATPQNNGFNNSGNQSSPFASNGSNTNSAFGNNAFGSTSTNGGFSNSGNANSGNANSSSGFGSSASGFGSSNSSSTIQSGGLAGVASKVERHSIKVVNDQQDYSLWEFYYDPTKDPALNAAGAALAGNGGTAGQPGNSPIQSGNSFGQQQNGNGQSPFGQSGSFGRRSEGLNNFGSSNNSFGAGSGFSNSGFSNGNNQNTTSGQQQQTGAPPSPQLPPQ